MGMKVRSSMDFEVWRRELLLCGAIVQDDDPLAGTAEAAERFERYLTLVGVIALPDADSPNLGQGRPGKLPSAVAEWKPEDVIQALIDSVCAPHDYGAYEATHNALWSFEPQALTPALARALPDFIRRMEPLDQVGRFLCPLAGWAQGAYLEPFTRALGELSKKDQAAVIAWVQKEETEGYFEDAPGLIRPRS